MCLCPSSQTPGSLMARFHSEPPDNFLGRDWNFSWSLWYRWDPGKSFFALQETYKTHSVISAWQTPDKHLTDTWQTPDRPLTDRSLTDPCNYFHSIPLAKWDTGESWGLAIFPGLMQKKGYIFPLLSGTKINWEILSFALLFIFFTERNNRQSSF